MSDGDIDATQCRLSPSVVLLGTNQCRLQAVRVDALFVVMLLSSLDSVEHVNLLSSSH